MIHVTMSTCSNTCVTHLYRMHATGKQASTHLIMHLPIKKNVNYDDLQSWSAATHVDSHEESQECEHACSLPEPWKTCIFPFTVASAGPDTVLQKAACGSVQQLPPASHHLLHIV